MARDRDSPRQILKGPGFTNVRAGLFTSIPCVFGARAIVGFGYVSGRLGDRFRVLTGICSCAAVGMGLAGPLHDRTGVLAEFSLAVAGLYGMKSPLWPLPSTALADGLTVINSAGDFRGYPGPIAPGYTKDMTGSFESGIYVLSTACLVSTLTAPGCASWMKAPQRGAALALS